MPLMKEDALGAWDKNQTCTAKGKINNRADNKRQTKKEWGIREQTVRIEGFVVCKGRRGGGVSSRPQKGKKGLKQRLASCGLMWAVLMEHMCLSARLKDLLVGRWLLWNGRDFLCYLMFLLSVTVLLLASWRLEANILFFSRNIFVTILCLVLLLLTHQQYCVYS